MKNGLVLFLLIISMQSTAGELTTKSYLDGLKTSFQYFYQGAYLQFTEKNNAAVTVVAVPSLWYAFEEDKRITNQQMTKKIHNYMKTASDLAPFLSMPILTSGFYSYGVLKDNTRAVQFATETFATLYLALIESSALSLIQIHERPRMSELSGWEKNFRSKSSFPSGHVIPYIAVAFKTYQFYGPYYAILPSALYVATAFQRMRSGRHYFSDVVGSIFLTAFAAEGVRKAGGFSENHPSFKRLFERDIQLGYISYMGTVGPKISFTW